MATATTNTDPKFLPKAAQLEVVGLKVGEVRTNEQIMAHIESNLQNIDLLEHQISVEVYILVTRGVEKTTIGARFGWSEDSVSRHATYGLAILRTGETTKTVNAIKTASLSMQAVKDVTAKGEPHEKIEALTKAAVVKAVAQRYTTVGGSEPTEEQVRQVLDEVPALAEANAEPATAASFVAQIPAISEKVGLKAKETTRKPSKQGESGPMAVEFNVRKTIADAKAIAEATKADYVPTPQDVKAVMDLCSFLGLALDLEPEMAAAVEALNV